jgi:hypothetical protein
MSAWEFMCCTTGYAKANGLEGKPEGTPMSDERARDLGIID